MQSQQTKEDLLGPTYSAKNIGIGLQSLPKGKTLDDIIEEEKQIEDMRCPIGDFDPFKRIERNSQD